MSSAAAADEPGEAQPLKQAEPSGTPVKFIGTRSGDKYKVVATTSAGNMDCEVPCTLHLPPGSAHIRVSGTKSYEQDIDVLTDPMTVTLDRPCPSCLGAAGAVTTIGAVIVVLGLFVIPNDSSCNSRPDPASCLKSAETVGNLFAGIGVVTVAIGLTMAGVMVFQPSPHLTPKKAAKASPFEAPKLVANGGGLGFSF